MKVTDGHRPCRAHAAVPTHLDMLATGLHECRGWDEDDVSAYFQRVGLESPAA